MSPERLLQLSDEWIERATGEQFYTTAMDTAAWMAAAFFAYEMAHDQIKRRTEAERKRAIEAAKRMSDLLAAETQRREIDAIFDDDEEEDGA